MSQAASVPGPAHGAFDDLYQYLNAYRTAVAGFREHAQEHVARVKVRTPLKGDGSVWGAAVVLRGPWASGAARSNTNTLSGAS